MRFFRIAPDLAGDRVAVRRALYGVGTVAARPHPWAPLRRGCGHPEDAPNNNAVLQHVVIVLTPTRGVAALKDQRTQIDAARLPSPLLVRSRPRAATCPPDSWSPPPQTSWANLTARKCLGRQVVKWIAKRAARFSCRQLSGFEECSQRVSSLPPAIPEYPSLDDFASDRRDDAKLGKVSADRVDH
jgi:hypothetical protein